MSLGNTTRLDAKREEMNRGPRGFLKSAVTFLRRDPVGFAGYTQVGVGNDPAGNSRFGNDVEGFGKIGGQHVPGVVLKDGSGALEGPRHQSRADDLAVYPEGEFGGGKKGKEQADIGEKTVGVVEAVGGEGDGVVSSFHRRVEEVDDMVFRVEVNADVALLYAGFLGLHEHAVLIHKERGVAPVGELRLATPVAQTLPPSDEGVDSGVAMGEQEIPWEGASHGFAGSVAADFMVRRMNACFADGLLPARDSPLW